MSTVVVNDEVNKVSVTETGATIVAGPSETVAIPAPASVGIVTVTSGPTVVTAVPTVAIVSAGTQGPAGAQGTPGATGPQGPAGSGGDLTYDYSFSNASSVTVTHNLGKYPAVQVKDSAGDLVEGDIDHLSQNQLTISFSAPFSGTVILN